MSWLSRLVASLAPQIKFHSVWYLRRINWRWRFAVFTSVFPCQYQSTNVLFITKTLQLWQSIVSVNSTIQFILFVYNFLLLLFVSVLFSSFVRSRLSSSSFYCLLFLLFTSFSFPSLPVNEQSRTLLITYLTYNVGA